jgi:hypothetical protein
VGFFNSQIKTAVPGLFSPRKSLGSSLGIEDHHRCILHALSQILETIVIAEPVK